SGFGTGLHPVPCLTRGSLHYPQERPGSDAKKVSWTTPRNSRLDLSSTLVPLDAFFIGAIGFVEPLQAKRLFTQDRGFETSPCLDFKVVERTVFRPKPVWHSRRKVNQRARFDFLKLVLDFNHAAPLERHVAMGGALRIRRRTVVHVIGRRTAFMVVH